LAVGVINDALKGTYGNDAVRYSLLSAAVTTTLGALLFVWAARSIREDIKRVGVRIHGALARARMNNERPARLPRQVHMAQKQFLLLLLHGIGDVCRAEIIQAAFPNRHNRRIHEEVPIHVFIEFFPISIRVLAHRRPKSFALVRKVCRFPAGVCVTPYDQTPNPILYHPRRHLLPIRLVGIKLHMAMRVEVFHASNNITMPMLCPRC